MRYTPLPGYQRVGPSRTSSARLITGVQAPVYRSVHFGADTTRWPAGSTRGTHRRVDHTAGQMNRPNLPAVNQKVTHRLTAVVDRSRWLLGSRPRVVAAL